MIQNCLGESMIKNYKAPNYPIFVSIQNKLHSIQSKETFKEARTQIPLMVEHVGSEGERFVLLTLIKTINFPSLKDKSSESFRIQLLSELLQEYTRSESFLSYFPQIVALNSEGIKPIELVKGLFSTLNLSIMAEVIISLSLFLSDRHEYSQEGENQLVKKLAKLKKMEKGPELPERIIDELLFQISRHPQLNLKLEEEYNYLLESSQKQTNKTDAKIYNFFQGDWQYFASETPEIEKPPSFNCKKVDLLKDAGPAGTFQIETLKSIFNDGTPLTQEDIFQCILLMAEEKGRNDTAADRFAVDILSNKKGADLKKILSNADLENKKFQGTWNVENFITFCASSMTNLKWQNVLLQFDRQKLAFSSKEHFLNVMKIFQKTKKMGPKWKTPENLYFKKWNHPHSQIIFLLELFECKDLEILYLHEIPNRKIQKSVKDCNSLQKQIWGYLELLQLLIQLSEYKYMQVRQLLTEVPLAKYPEPFLLALSEIRPSKGQPMLDEIFSQVIPQYLQNHTINIKFLDNLWELNQDLMISCIAEVYKAQSKKENSFNLSRVLDITQAIRDSLIPFTTWNDYEFSIPLAIIAGKREFLNFEPWVIDRIEKVGNSFIKAILKYIDSNLIVNLKRNVSAAENKALKETILEKAQLTIELLNKIFYSIMSKTKREEITPRNFQLLKRLFKDCCTYFPEIAQGQVPDEIQRETQREINKIYKEEITIKEAIQRMRKLKNSQKQEDQEQLASHITFLCSELSYHHSYPEKELLITAQLFGAIINANLIEKKVYQMFLHVLEDDLKEENQKYLFALKVMERIKDKLANEVWFCEKLIDIENIMKKDPEVVDQLIKKLDPPKQLSTQKEKRIKEAIKYKNSPPVINEPTGPFLPAEEESVIEPLKKGQVNDYDILQTLDETKKLNMPDRQSKLSKINTACNNLSLTNIEEKAKDLEKLLDNEKTITLLVHNIVFKRVSIAQNNGTEMFFRLVEKLPEIQRPVLKITYKILQRWFSLQGKSCNDKKLAHFKNIGSWLGKLTIARGIPIPIYKLNMKNILINSFSVRNRLAMDVPVILKILQFINVHPSIFRSSSPWLIRLFGTLNQIEDKLKEDISTKDQIKAFFKTLKTQNLNNIPQTSYLSNNPRITISELDKYIKVDEELEKYYSPMKINLKMIITQAVDKSIQEIVEPVIDRAVKIAKVTTKQLIMKDFALESDSQKLRESCYNMIKKMAGPLAQVTCREPLKASMNRNLKNELSQTFENENEIDNIIQKVIPYNLDFGCTLIKQAVIESAEDVIKKDSSVNQSIEMRKKARENGEEFRDDIYMQDIPPIVPEELRPKPGGLTFEELSIYQQFKKDKKPLTSEKEDERTTMQKINEIIYEKSSVKQIKELLSEDASVKEELVERVHSLLVKEELGDTELSYYISVCEILREFCDQKEVWVSFKEKAQIKRKDIVKIIRVLVQKKYFYEGCLNELDESNEEENKIIGLFENWLDTAHEEIEYYLRGLEEIFNKSQNQIKLFFSCCLSYAMQKVSESMLPSNQSYDTNYVEAYSKLIIISYKTIASNNCSLYFEHTLQAILEVFNRLMQGPKEVSYQRPLFKLFTNLICDVNRKEYDIESQKILTFYCVLAKELKKISPLLHPNFGFAWVELISNKYFMSALLKEYRLWDLYFQLLSCLLQFAREQITQEQLKANKSGQAYQYFYKGIIKLIIIIIHDFPDFLSEFSLQLCLVPGEKHIQLCNMLSSAYPGDMKFELPSKVDKRDKLEAQVKKGGYPKYYRLKFDKEKNKFDQYLSSDVKDSSFKAKLESESDELLQVFILYVGWVGEHRLSESEAHKKLLDILNHSPESLKDRLLNLIINLIRYPNTITLFFIDFATSTIFKQTKDTKTRDLLLSRIIRRMNAEGPYGWGLHYLVKQLQILKNELATLHVPKSILDHL